MPAAAVSCGSSTCHMQGNLPGQQSAAWEYMGSCQGALALLRPGWLLTLSTAPCWVLTLSTASPACCSPRDRPRRSTATMVNDPYTLVVALDEQGKALGDLYIDDGRSFAFTEGQYLHERCGCVWEWRCDEALPPV